VVVDEAQQDDGNFGRAAVSKRRKSKRAGEDRAKIARRHALHIFPGRYTRPGTAPGDLSALPAGEQVPVRMSLMDYAVDELTEKSDCSLETARQFFESPRATWLHVQGTPSAQLLQDIGEAYELHALALEDVLHTGQRAKLEAYDDQLFAIVGAPEFGEHGIELQQLSIFLGETWIVSFYSGRGDPFEPLRHRLRTNQSRLRRNPVDYLFYALLDTAIDLAFPVMELLGERIERLEESVFEHPGREALDEIHKLKRELVLMRRALWPQRDMMNGMLRDDHVLITQGTRLYLRDCYDHTVHALDLVESYREMASSLLDVYLSSLSYRMNDVMKVLTIIATVFIPLSFVVGVYGMNFDRQASPWNMPELGMRFGYPVLWLVMLALVGGMLFYFRRKRWF